MAFVRKVRTKSGATAVQVARYVGGRQEIVKHIGSAHTDVELGMLLERARAWLEPDQQALDLDVTPRVPVEKPLVTGQSALLEPAAESVQVDAPGRTESTGSVLLRQVLAQVYDQLGFGIVDDAVFRDLLIARMSNPARNSMPAGCCRISGRTGRATPRSNGTWSRLPQVSTGTGSLRSVSLMPPKPAA